MSQSTFQKDSIDLGSIWPVIKWIRVAILTFTLNYKKPWHIWLFILCRWNTSSTKCIHDSRFPRSTFTASSKCRQYLDVTMLRVEFPSLATLWLWWHCGQVLMTLWTGSDEIVDWVILGPDSTVDARCDKPINKWGMKALTSICCCTIIFCLCLGSFVCQDMGCSGSPKQCYSHTHFGRRLV